MKHLANHPQAPGAMPDGNTFDPAGPIELDDAALTAVTGGVIFIDIDTDTWDRHDCQCTPC